MTAVLITEAVRVQFDDFYIVVELSGAQIAHCKIDKISWQIIVEIVSLIAAGRRPAEASGF